MRYFMRVLTAALVVAGMTTVGASKAQADFITSVSQLQVDGTMNPNQFGPAFTQLPGPQFGSMSGVVTTSILLESLSGGMTRYDQGAGADAAWLPGTAVLSSGTGGRGLPEWRSTFLNSFTGDPSPVAGFALQYQLDLYGPFSVGVDIFDTSGLLLGSRNYQGLSSNAADGSALWLGYSSDLTSVGSFALRDTTFTSNAFASGIGPISVQSSPVSPVPGPSSIVILGIGAGVLAIGRAVRRKRNPDAKPTVAA